MEIPIKTDNIYGISKSIFSVTYSKPNKTNEESYLQQDNSTKYSSRIALVP
jgi:hypothetical protein